jgi:hypothetical protein
MIKDNCFTEAWLEAFKRQRDHSRIDKIVLEKMIYALHLLERLTSNGLSFVFKGGTSLLLLVEETNRFSIDIDIICITAREELEAILDKVVSSSRFKEWKLDERRSYRQGVPKVHYMFSFETSRHGSGTILLDVLVEDSLYPELTEKPLTTKWIETDEETMITVPTFDAITGDKLTAFAPNTIGIPYFKGEDRQSFSMEICKQLFDLSKLFERVESMEIIAASYQAFAKQEIAYRQHAGTEVQLTPEAVLHDTINTCLILTKRGNGSVNEIAQFNELQKGIKALDGGYLMTGHFRIDDAIPAAARIAYLVARLLVKDYAPIAYYEGQDIKAWNIEESDWTFLNKLKKQPDKSSFYYWYLTLQTLTYFNGKSV